MSKILIFGCGSIGAHMANASIKLGHRVYITDINTKKMEYFRNFFFISRYKYFSPNIYLINHNEVFSLKEKFDLVIIGTPPSTHINILQNIIKNINYKKILIEKPITTIFDKKIKFLNIKKYNRDIYCGYNHSISKSFNYFLQKIKNIKKISVIDVSWKEGWTNILKAHPWLKNEFESYLGNIKVGGGALHEHSHGLHILIIILNFLKIKLNKKNSNNILFKINKNVKYDLYSSFVDKVKDTFIKYETDLITNPAKKQIYIKYKTGEIKLIFGYKSNYDCVLIKNKKKVITKFFKKTRSSEFENEIKHVISSKSSNKSNLNPIMAIRTLNIIKKLIMRNNERYI